MSGGVMTAAVNLRRRGLTEVIVWENGISWEGFFDGFSHWSAEKLQRMIPRVMEFGPSDEVCEAVCRMPNFALGELLYHRALCHGVRFTREELIQIGHAPRGHSATGFRAWLEIAAQRWNYY